MPWDITIRATNGEPLGDRESVVERITAALQGIRWIEQPPLLERIKDIPNHPFHKLIPAWPEETRASFARSKLLGDFQGNSFSIQLYGFENMPIIAFHAEVRGNGDPLPVLVALCVPNGWNATDDSNGRTIDLAENLAEGWQEFREYRGRVVKRNKKLFKG